MLSLLLTDEALERAERAVDEEEEFEDPEDMPNDELEQPVVAGRPVEANAEEEYDDEEDDEELAVGFIVHISPPLSDPPSISLFLSECCAISSIGSGVEEVTPTKNLQPTMKTSKSRIIQT